MKLINIIVPYCVFVSDNFDTIHTKSGVKRHPAASKWQRDVKMLVQNQRVLGAELTPPLSLDIAITVGPLGRLPDWHNFTKRTIDAVARGLEIDDGGDNFSISGSVKRGSPAQIELIIKEVRNDRKRKTVKCR